MRCSRTPYWDWEHLFNRQALEAPRDIIYALGGLSGRLETATDRGARYVAERASGTSRYTPTHQPAATVLGADCETRSTPPKSRVPKARILARSLKARDAEVPALVVCVRVAPALPNKVFRGSALGYDWEVCCAPYPAGLLGRPVGESLPESAPATFRRPKAQR